MCPDIIPTDPFVKEVFAALDAIRASGKVNMFGAGTVLQDMYGFDAPTANRFVAEWMKHFGKKPARKGRK